MATSWTAPVALEAGVEVTADDYNKLVTCINKLGNQLVSGAANLKDLDDLASLGLGPPEYDSDWFASTTSTTYTNAHSLSATPGLVIVLHSTTATPGAGDEIVWPVTEESNAGSHPGADGTNTYVTTLGTNVVGTARRTSSGGFLRVLAWTLDVS